jgi:RNA recognition motif-containing protein
MGKKLYVGNLTYEVTDGFLSRMFETASPIAHRTSCGIINNQEIGFIFP